MIGTLLERHGWRLEMLDSNHYCYKRNMYQFEVEHANESIFVTVPLPGSDSRYQTKLYSTDVADNYLTSHMEYIEKIEMLPYENSAADRSV